MITRRTLTSLGLGTLAAGAASPAWAHRQKLTYTEIEWLAEAKEIGVTHRLHMHDAARALVAENLLDAPVLTDLRAQAILALYISEQFAIYGADGTRIALTLIGAQIDGSDIFVFQTAALNAPPRGLSIFCEILHGAYASQKNHVTVNLPGEIHTLTFKVKDPVKTVF
ncbi:DUF6702 family protein [Robiginitomaculum antarcticum]|uniref:DUF6702 family protein n=1 Tax=Robiginitomaculum antarcticum TaxID=437507 RepID=UPI00036A2983|nr:DUF6702 family protein [Robiginitomaculum antarcticum]